MEVSEAFRRIIAGHWVVLLLALILPVAVVGVVATKKPASYVSSARIQASSTPPGSDTEADSVLNRVKGIATSMSVVTRALSKVQGPTRSPTHVADVEVGLSRLGSSAVFDLSVTDSDPALAQALTEELTKTVVDFLNTSGIQHADALIADLQNRQQKAISQRQARAATLGVTKAPVAVADLTAQLGTLDQEISDLSSSLRQFQLSGATATSAAMISDASQAKLVAPHLSTDLALALVAGLVGGLMISTLLEVARPRVADAHAFARELSSPMLGPVLANGWGTPASQDLGAVVPKDVLVAVRGAAMRAGVGTLVMTGSVEPDRMLSLVTGLEGQLNSSNLPAGRSTGDQPALNGDRSTATPVTNGKGSVKTLTPSPVRTSNARARPRLNVVQLANLDDEPTTGLFGLVVVVGTLTPYSDLRRVIDLVAATGWPVIGVLAHRRTGLDWRV
jgi:hypothetical protein